MMQKTDKNSLEYKEKVLTQWLLQYEGVIVAFSGGVDSALLLFLSRRVLGKEKAVGVIAKSESLKTKDYELATDFAEKYDISLTTVFTKELQNPDYYKNSPLRCYFCKTETYREIKEVQKKLPGYIIVNGANLDDKSDYRPGEKAASENNVFSPFVIAGITKHDIRQLAAKYGLPVWNKPASPCLSSRIPYGQKVSPEKLKQIETAEEILNNHGFFEVRARHYGSKCKIEVPEKDIPYLKAVFNDISREIKEKAGFSEVIIDTEGLVSGKLNRELKKQLML